VVVLGAAGDATPATPADTVVARVDGHPIYASCVAAQAAHDRVDARAALRECIDFELLARAAAARGLAADAEVDDARRAAMVNRLVERDYEDHEFTPADFGPLWPQIVRKLGPRVDHPEYRASAYVRVPVAHDGGSADAAARAVADQIAAAAGSASGLFPVDLVELATPIAAAAGAKLDHDDVPAYAAIGLDKSYADALFAIPDVGRTTSKAAKTKWGWDVILFTADVPAAHPVADAYTAALVAEGHKQYFTAWVSSLEHAMGLTVSIDKDAVARLEDLP
jgi:hypothetical protein